MTLNAATDSESGTLSGGELSKVQSNNNDRWETKDGENTTYQFTNPTIPGGATITSVVIYVVHHEEDDFSGSVQWTTDGSSTNPTIRTGEGNEAEDSWNVTSIITTVGEIDALTLVIQNNDGGGKKTKSDYIYAEVEWLG